MNLHPNIVPRLCRCAVTEIGQDSKNCKINWRLKLRVRLENLG